MSAFSPIHQHLFLRATVKELITNTEELKNMLVQMVAHLGMVAVTAPQAVYITDAGNEGLTGSINLATSHIAVHIWDTTRLLMMDVYSCKDFDSAAAVAEIEKYFGGFREVEYRTLDRTTFKEI